MSDRNLYDDNIFDVSNIDNIKNEQSIAVLEKTDSRILFEFANDFFKYNFESEELLQYPDFVSLKRDKNFKDATETDYGFAIVDSINSSKEIEFLKNYNLRDRENYIKKDITEGLFNIPVNIANSIKKQTDTIKRAVELKKPEFQDVNATVNALIDSISLFYCFYKTMKIKAMKEGIITTTLEKLTQKNATSIIRDPELMKAVPELQDVIKKAKDFDIQFKVDPEKSNFKQKVGRVHNIVDYALGNAELLNVCEKVSNTELYQNNLEKVSKKFDDIFFQINDTKGGTLK